MKNSILLFFVVLFISISCNSNNSGTSATNTTSTQEPAQTDLGQAGVQDDDSQKDIVKVAVGSKDHTTLVAALKQADYVNDLANAGPFTVFAPTNAAFDKLPPGTVDGLMKPDQSAALKNILEYHVAVGGYKQDMLQDGQNIGMANGDNINVKIKDGKMTINGKANILASVQASNGLVYIIDEVLLPPAK